MKKNANKQKQEQSALKRTLAHEGRKLKWLSESTGINYQRLQRIINQGYEPTISEAARISNALKRPLQELFPSLDLSNAMKLPPAKQATKEWPPSEKGKRSWAAAANRIAP